MLHGMTIGALAKAAGVSVETIRYYQRLGLIGEPRRPPGGQRQYSEQAVGELRFVQHGQQLGFTLAEIKDLLRLAGTKSWAEVRKVAERRYARLVLHAGQLTVMSVRLNALLRQSRRHKGRGLDPIIAALQGAALRTRNAP